VPALAVFGLGGGGRRRGVVEGRPALTAGACVQPAAARFCTTHFMVWMVWVASSMCGG